MHLPILLTLALTAGATDHAPLHPSDADLFVELPDPAGLLEAMRGSALLNTFRDPGVVEFIGALSGEQGFDVDAVLEEAWSEELPADLRTLLEGAAGASLSLRAGEGPPDFQLVAEFASAELAAGALQAVVSQQRSEPIDAAGWEGALLLPESDELNAWVQARGSLLVLASGSLRTDATAARLAGDGTGISTHALYQRADAALGEPKARTLAHGFFRRSPVTLVSEALMMTPGAPGAELGMLADMNLGAGSHRFRMGSDGSRYVTEIFSPDTNEETAFQGVLGAKPVDPGLAGSIPTGLMGAFATTIDPQALSGLLENGLAMLAAQTGDASMLEGIEAELGFPVQRLFTHLGSQLTMQMQAIKGMGLPETAIWVELADADAFAADLAVIAEKLPSLLPGFESRSRAYKVKNAEGERVPYEITSLSLPDGMIELPIPITIQPSVAVANGRLLFGLSSTHVKRELKRLFGAEPPDPTAVDPWKNASLAIPEGAHAAFFMDWGEQISGLVSLAKALGPMAGDQLPIDLSILPDGETFVQHFRPTVHFQVPREGGTYRYHEASFGPETWLLPLAGFTSSQSVGPVAADGFPLDENQSASGVVDVDTGFATQIALQQVRAAVSIYQVDRGTLPADLAALLGSSDAFPNGYLAGGELPTDGWGRALVYSLGEGDTYTLYSVGPNGLDESGGGDDVQAD